MSTPKNRSVQKAFAILRSFRAPDEWLTCAELSRRAGLPGASGYRLIQTLELIGAVIRDERGRYSPGMLLMSLSRYVAHDRLLRDAANAILTEVASDLGMIVHMGVLEDGMVTYVAKTGGGSSFHVHTEVGAQLEAYCSALGKVLLSALPQHELAMFLDEGDLVPLTTNTITDPSAFRSEIDRVRRQGWALDDCEISRNMRCVAVPIKDATGQIVAAISSSGEASSVTEEQQEKILARLRSAAEAIEANICRTGGPSPFRLAPREMRFGRKSAALGFADSVSH